MKKLLLGTILLALVFVFPIPAMTAVNVGVSISLPPPIVFAAPPEVIVIPGTYVYAVPDLDVDMFFYRGWWWRLWQGRWYRSRNYNAGWGYFRNAPSFYRGVPAGWRNDYRAHRWQGHQWNYQRIPHQQVQQNWSNWEKSRHWEKQNTWGVQGLKPRARVTAAATSSPTTTSGRTEIPRGAATARTTTTSGGATTITATIRRGPTTAPTAATPRGATTI